jgi:hypothetical protein
MSKTVYIGLMASLFCVLATWPTKAIEPTVLETGCNMEGYSHPLRQTIVVIDQSAIDPSPGDPNGINRKWMNAIVGFAGVQEAQSSYVMSAPREHITVLLASQDGSDLVRVFMGCPPSYSSSELAEREKQSNGILGALKVFIGRDERSREEADKKAFRVSLLGALVQLQRERPRSKTNPEDRSFLDAFPAISQAFDLANGILG